jgi:2-hydroxychromene-2-carboxylate isomerase
MGDLIHLDRHRKQRPDPAARLRPAFFFDLSCPFSYLVAERVERTLGDADWVPVSSETLGAPRTEAVLETLREQALSRARTLRLPLVWPQRFPSDVRCALRAAVYATEIGAGTGFALAAARLAFCGGFDLDDPETLAEAAAASGVPLEGCLEAASDAAHDDSLTLAADELRSRGVQSVPAIDVGGRLFEGESGLLGACTVLRSRVMPTGPLAPAG